MLVDLLSAEEGEFDARTGALRFDIGRCWLAGWRASSTGWREQSHHGAVPIGLFGASTGRAPRRWSPPPGGPERCGPWCPGAGGRTWPASAGRGARADAADWSAGVTSRSIELNERATSMLAAPHRLHVVAPWRPTCSRSPGRWRRWLTGPVIGSEAYL